MGNWLLSTAVGFFGRVELSEDGKTDEFEQRFNRSKGDVDWLEKQI